MTAMDDWWTVRAFRRVRAVRFPIFLRCMYAGLFIALAMPSPGWWPLAFVGLAMWDRLLADTNWKQRIRRTWLVGVVWFFPTMVWMGDLTPPGYVIACVSYALYYGVACAFVPPGRARWFAFPGAVVLATAAMWTAPFGGVPLANLALTQAHSCAPQCVQIDSPLIYSARLFGPLLVVALVVVGGIALSAAIERQWRAAKIAAAIVVGCTLLGIVAPKGHDIGESIEVAVVQGGGPQHTRFGNEDADLVLQRHILATRQQVTKPVDVILWPENVIAVEGPLSDNEEVMPRLQALAKEKDATLLVGATEGVDRNNFLNAEIVINPDGTVGDRYDKVRIVPFGEFVPFRSLLESILGDGYLPSRDAIPGTDLPGDDHGVLHTEAGDFGTVISWETFFDGRARDSIVNGGEILTNPTNGASYLGTQEQTQQIASSRLRAMETGRWMLQAAPTGYSAVIDPDGKLLRRSGISERWVTQLSVPKRSGNTVSNIVGPWPMFVLSIGGFVLAWARQRRHDRSMPASGHAATGAAVAAGDPPGSELDEAVEVDRLEEAPIV